MRTVAQLLGQMTREEKVAQLLSVWVTVDSERGEVAPYQGNFMPDPWVAGSLEEQLRHGMGQLTRPFGSAPVAAGDGARIVADLQRRLREDTRLGIPAIVHEECLTGFMTLGATEFPNPLAWGATWDPALIEQVGDAIRRSMRAVGAHQGLGPVLDVVRDPRWGRVEECIAEDPYLVGTIGSAYIRGLQGGDLRDGIVATAKHFAGYSFSEGGRNLAPSHIGPREMADVFLIPFEMAVKVGGVRSIMNAYQEIDGLPAAASHELLTETLRDRWGFEGIVVADYFSVSFLQSLHGAADGKPEAAARALEAGLDVELPNFDCFPSLPESDALDRAVTRVLRLKEALGLLDDGVAGAAPEELDLDPPEHRALARRVAERSITLLKNDGVLPLPPGARIALVGPNASSPTSVLGNYTFAVQVGSHHPDAVGGAEVVTIADAMHAASHARGCDVLGDDRSGFDDAIAAARGADVAVVVIGDQSGQFGAGTSGEGTDADDLRLPGVQEELVDAVVGTGTPTVVVLVTGRPYAIPTIAERAGAVVAAWLPGEEAGNAVADVLFGRVNPCGKTTVTWSRGAGQQPIYYNDKKLGRTGYARSTTRPVFPFGHGLSYTTFDYSDLGVSSSELAVDGSVDLSCVVRNAGDRPGAEVVQLYVHDLAASIARPVQELKGFARIELDPGQAVRVVFTLHADMLSFTGVDLRRRIEPGRVDVFIGASSADIRLRASIDLVGAVRFPGEDRVLITPTRQEDA